MPTLKLLVIGACGLSTAIPLSPVGPSNQVGHARTVLNAAALPANARCLREADHDFDRLFADQLDGSGNPGRRATEADCNYLCSDESSEKHTWCIGFEFRDTEKGMCELYDDCSSQGSDSPASPTVMAQEAPAKEAQAASAKSPRCLRVSDHDFGRLFAEQLDGSGNLGRKATEADCSYACSDPSSGHQSWCIGFEFRDTEKGMCELYDDCSSQGSDSSAPSAEEHTTPFATEATQAAPGQQAVAEAASSKTSRCLRVADHDFHSSFADQLDANGKVGRKGTEGDCSFLCSDESSEKHKWCVGSEFRDTEKGMCELYDECTEAVAKERLNGPLGGPASR